jgi:hypothetical protein
VHGDEAGRQAEHLAGLQGLRHVAAQRDIDGIPHRLHGQRDEPRLKGEVANGDADVAPPHVHDGRAPAVVGGVHAHEVALLETALHGLHPVVPVGMGGAGVSPVPARVAWRGSQTVGGGHPGIDGDGLVARVGVGHVQQRDARVFVEQRDNEALLQAFGRAADEAQALAGAEHGRGPARLGLLHREARDGAALHDDVLAGVEAGQRKGLSAEQAHDTAAQLVVELQRQRLVLHAHMAAALRLRERQLRGQRRGAKPPQEGAPCRHGLPLQAPGKTRSAFVR